MYRRYKTSAQRWTESAKKVWGLVKDMYAPALVEEKPVPVPILESDVRDRS